MLPVGRAAVVEVVGVKAAVVTPTAEVVAVAGGTGSSADDVGAMTAVGG